MRSIAALLTRAAGLSASASARAATPRATDDGRDVRGAAVQPAGPHPGLRAGPARPGSATTQSIRGSASAGRRPVGLGVGPRGHASRVRSTDATGAALPCSPPAPPGPPSWPRVARLRDSAIELRPCSRRPPACRPRRRPVRPHLARMDGGRDVRDAAVQPAGPRATVLACVATPRDDAIDSRPAHAGRWPVGLGVGLHGHASREGTMDASGAVLPCSPPASALSTARRCARGTARRRAQPSSPRAYGRDRRPPSDGRARRRRRDATRAT